jgi:DNA processing protein
MPSVIPGRWCAAARWSDRLDLRPALEQVGGPRAFLQATSEELRDAGFPPGLIGALLETADQPTRYPWVHLGGPGYPARLLDLRAPPPLLQLRGDPALLSAPSIAVVGSRACTAYGRRIARRLAGVIEVAGGAVVSGGAWGIDEAAHRASPRGVMVLGRGLEAPETQRERALLGAVLAAGGLAMSELCPADPALPWTFPRRNRLIAALARAVVVVEAGAGSGALHTARQAAELGRPLFAVPGPLDAPASAGALSLIAEGAACLVDFGAISALIAARESPLARLKRALDPPAAPSEAARRAGLPLEEALRALLMLELTGEARRLPDQRYELLR